jgi:hypothetical protein
MSSSKAQECTTTDAARRVLRDTDERPLPWNNVARMLAAVHTQRMIAAQNQPYLGSGIGIWATPPVLGGLNHAPDRPPEYATGTEMVEELHQVMEYCTYTNTPFKLMIKPDGQGGTHKGITVDDNEHFEGATLSEVVKQAWDWRKSRLSTTRVGG